MDIFIGTIRGPFDWIKSTIDHKTLIFYPAVPSLPSKNIRDSHLRRKYEAMNNNHTTKYSLDSKVPEKATISF